MAEKRLNPAVWTILGTVLGLVWAVDPLGGFSFQVSVGTVLLGTFAGAFVSVIVAAWPYGRRIPEVRCPACGRPMPRQMVVCPECGEIR